jgi:predicted RNase H-like HicB family nuclease
MLEIVVGQHRYEAEVLFDGDTWLIDFQDIGCMAYGDTFEAAKLEAEEAVMEWLAFHSPTRGAA